MKPRKCPPKGCCAPTLLHAADATWSANKRPNLVSSIFRASCSVGATTKFCTRAGVMACGSRPASCAVFWMIWSLAAYSSCEAIAVGYQPSPYCPVSRSMRGPCPPIQISGVLPFGARKSITA